MSWVLSKGFNMQPTDELCWRSTWRESVVESGKWEIRLRPGATSRSIPEPYLERPKDFGHVTLDQLDPDELHQVGWTPYPSRCPGAPVAVGEPAEGRVTGCFGSDT